MSDIIQLLGRFHPLILHLPIGVLAYAYTKLLYDKFFNKKRKKESISFALAFGALGAIVSSISGYILSLEGGYDQSLLDWHKYLGIGLAVASIILYVLYQMVRDSKAFVFVFTMVMVLMGITGHYGGSLTHGSDYLTKASSNEVASLDVEDPKEAVVYQDVVFPILKQKCLSCHNTQKLKGGLLMTTFEELMKGGDHGAVVLIGKVEESSLIERILLPQEEEEHMPPSGKLQVTPDELDVLKWWVANLNEKSDLVGDYPENKKVMNYINGRMGIGLQDMMVMDATDLRALRNSNLKIAAVGEEKPFIMIDGGRKTLLKSDFKLIQKYAPNILNIDLEGASFNPKLLKYIADCSILESLDLGSTPITNGSLSYLENLDRLKSLNLYGTSINADGLKNVLSLAKLEQIYLWQTDVSASEINELADERPQLSFTGAIGDVFGDAKLAPPNIKADKDIFEDTLAVELSSGLQGVKIYYTLNGADPDSNSTQYISPITLDQTAMLRAVSMKDGWNTSAFSSQSFIRAKYKVDDLILKQKPEDQYSGNGEETLIDFVKGSEVFTDGNWLGFQGKDVEMILDLSQEEEVSKLAISALDDYVSYIFYPRKFTVSTSTDGKVFESVQTVEFPEETEPFPKRMKNFLVEFAAVPARYIKLEVESQRINPDWHPAPGAKSWLFLDEITVE